MRDKVKKHFKPGGIGDDSWLDGVELPTWGLPTPEQKAQYEREQREAARQKRIRELEAKAERLKQEAKDATDPRFDRSYL